MWCVPPSGCVLHLLCARDLFRLSAQTVCVCSPKSSCVPPRDLFLLVTPWAKPISVLHQGQCSAQAPPTLSCPGFPWLADSPADVCFTFQAQRDIIFELRRIAFDAESDPSNVPGSGTEKRKAMYTKDYKMLGFTVSFPKQGPGRPSALTGSQRVHPAEPWAPLLHGGGPGIDVTKCWRP